VAKRSPRWLVPVVVGDSEVPPAGLPVVLRNVINRAEYKGLTRKRCAQEIRATEAHRFGRGAGTAVRRN